MRAHPDAVAGRARRPAVDLRGSSTPARTGWREPCWRGAAPGRRRCGGDRAQPGLDGRRPRRVQGRRRVPAHRAAFPGRPHRDHALPGRVPARGDRARQHCHAEPGPRPLPGMQTLFADAAYKEHHADGDPGIAVAPDQLAYIYFTSGSTGEPKGAMCEHAGMLNHLCAKIDDLEIGEGQVVAQTAPQCFDISLWQLISALLVGRTHPDDRAGGDPGRRAVPRHGRPRPGRCPPGRAVVPGRGAVLPGAAPSATCRTCDTCRSPARR